MLPVIIGVAAVASLLFAGCSDTNKGEEDAGVNDTDTSSDVDTDVDTDTDVDSDTDVDTDVDTDTGTDTGTDTDTTPDTPFAPGASVYSDAPCSFPASMSYNAADNNLLVTCGGAQNALWSSPTLGTSGDWTMVNEVGGYPSNHLQLDDRYTVVTHSNPDGFTIADLDDTVPSQTVEFGDLTITDGVGPLAFTPNNPSGIFYDQSGALLFIASSNIDVADYTNPELTTFHPGTLTYFQYVSMDGEVLPGTAFALPTAQVNPTGIARIDDDEFALLSAGAYDASAAALEFYSLPGFTPTMTNLGAVTGQPFASLPITDGGLILIGIQKPDNGMVGVDETTGIIEFDHDLLDEFDAPLIDPMSFLSGNNAYNDVAIMADFGIFGSGGQILFAHTDPAGWTGVPITPISWGSVGPTVVVGDTLYAAVTANDAMSGRIYEVNLSGMN